MTSSGRVTAAPHSLATVSVRETEFSSRVAVLRAYVLVVHFSSPVLAVSPVSEIDLTMP